MTRCTCHLANTKLLLTMDQSLYLLGANIEKIPVINHFLVIVILS
jgi:hypothetical protein